MLPVRMTAPFQPCGLFGAIRRFDIHTGVDFYCEHGEPVTALQGGIVTDVFTFTGDSVGTPWWNETSAVVVECGAITYVYGEIDSCVNIGDNINIGDVLGFASTVLKKDKGVTPPCMLHMEVWNTNKYIKNFTWGLLETKPEGLLDPLTVIEQDNTLCQWLIKTEVGYKLESSDGEHLQFFHMAADSKAHLTGQDFIYLRECSELSDKIRYTVSTGKALWFDYKGIWK